MPELESELLAVIAAWHEHGVEPSDEAFNDLALRIFAYQLRGNAPYARYCAARGVTLEAMPTTWEQIPPVPAAAYKEATLAAFDPAQAAFVFETSGTTQGRGGLHYMKTPALYDAALLAGFDRFMLPDGARLRYLNLVPNPAERPRSSLGYMMARVARERGDGRTGWYARGDALLLEEFFGDLERASADGAAVCIATTAFALLAALDAADARGLRFALPQGSRVMETGGFKGRTRVVSREELYARASSTFGVDADSIIAEYGMTELTSQWYDAPLRQAQGDKGRVKRAPAWLRARAVAPDGATLPDGVVGALVHVDLANLWSCVAVHTEDLGARAGGGIVLLGREQGAALRGCSLEAEMFLCG
ncbi:MAG TPA: hypothetical protein VIN40_00235 [Candidatus Tyrphobacter sp.]